MSSLALVVVLSGCLFDQGPGYRVNEKEAKATRANLVKTHTGAAELAVHAARGRVLTPDPRVFSITCYVEIGRRGFEDLRIAESFVVDGTSPSEIADRIERAWKAEGWKVHRDDDPTPELVYDTGPEGLERVVGAATTYLPGTLGAKDGQTVVRVSAMSPCISVPKELALTGWPAEVEPG